MQMKRRWDDVVFSLPPVRFVCFSFDAQAATAVVRKVFFALWLLLSTMSASLLARPLVSTVELRHRIIMTAIAIKTLLELFLGHAFLRQDSTRDWTWSNR